MNPRAPFPDIEIPDVFKRLLIAFLVGFALYQWCTLRRDRVNENKYNEAEKPDLRVREHPTIYDVRQEWEKDVRQEWEKRCLGHGLDRAEEEDERERA